MSVPATVLDRKPETEDERAVILGVIMDQAREVAGVDATVTCPCGHAAPIPYAFQCYHCGIWFCRRCASRHFGEPS